MSKTIEVDRKDPEFLRKFDELARSLRDAAQCEGVSCVRYEKGGSGSSLTIAASQDEVVLSLNSSLAVGDSALAKKRTPKEVKGAFPAPEKELPEENKPVS